MKEKFREYDVNEPVMAGKTNWCLVCEKKFKLGEKIVLNPVQRVKKGWGTVQCVPIHVKCFWVTKED